jgi:hypothetical protein
VSSDELVDAVNMAERARLAQELLGRAGHVLKGPSPPKGLRSDQPRLQGRNQSGFPTKGCSARAVLARAALPAGVRRGWALLGVAHAGWPGGWLERPGRDAVG